MTAALLTGKGLTLALAESCTGGLIAARLTELSGSSAYFVLGAVTYADSAKVALLGVPADLLARTGAVSAETAAAMAAGVRRQAGSDLGVAVTGIAGPDGGTTAKPVGTVFIALADARGVVTEAHRFSGDRAAVREQTVAAALDLLCRRVSATSG
jgi:nicotinamide-nucleotide amidase